MRISKSDYFRYLDCPRYLWLWKHDREKVTQEPSLPDLFAREQGNLVEEQARKLFPLGQIAKGTFQEAQKHTKELVEARTQTIFQATAVTDELLAMADILHFDPATKTWHLLEVKAGTKVEKDYLHDIGFQKIVFEKAGYEISRVFLIHVNTDYVRQGEINPQELLLQIDVTEEVEALKPEIESHIHDALETIQKKTSPKFEEFKIEANIRDPFIRDLCFPNLPEYSIFDINRLHKNKRSALLQNGILHVTDIPDDFPLSEKQRSQVTIAQNGKVYIDKEEIAQRLGALHYPLYFLDYETVSLAIPPFDGWKPYQVVPFQYSLHILPSPDVEPEHFEYLPDRCVDPSLGLVQSLQKHIKPDGTIIVWNKSFEMNCHKTIAEMIPEKADYSLSLNNNIFDLMEIFSQQLYVHPDFKGSASIKKVLPVLVPTLSHADGKIQDGNTASVTWWSMVNGQDETPEETYIHLKKYCALDTFAMVKIWEKLQNL